MDVNFTKLAGVLTGFSTNLQKGERVLIDAFDIPEAMVVALVRAARGRGAIPFVNIQLARISRELINDLDAEQFETQATWELSRMQKMDAYIAVRGSDNIFEMSDVDPSKVGQVMKAMKGVLDYRVNKTKWVNLISFELNYLKFIKTFFYLFQIYLSFKFSIHILKLKFNIC